MIDLHTHVLPGIDDGAATLVEALSICAAAKEDGIEVLAATPHVREDYPTSPESMERALAALRAAGPVVSVVAGGELDLAELARPKEELARFGLGGSRALLIETPYVGWPLDIAERLVYLQAHGFRPVLAHPERNGEVQVRPELLEPLVAIGALVQLTAASLDGRLGRGPRHCAELLLDRGLAHMVASDAHSAEIRATGLRAAVAELRSDELARWLTVDVPRAVLDDREPPPRPAARPRRRRMFGL